MVQSYERKINFSTWPERRSKLRNAWSIVRRRTRKIKITLRSNPPSYKFRTKLFPSWIEMVADVVHGWKYSVSLLRDKAGNRGLNWSVGWEERRRGKNAARFITGTRFRVTRLQRGETSRIIKRKHGCPRVTHLDGRKLDLRGWNWLTRTSHRFSRHKRYFCPALLSDYKRFFFFFLKGPLFLFFFFFSLLFFP